MNLERRDAAWQVLNLASSEHISIEKASCSVRNSRLLRALYLYHMPGSLDANLNLEVVRSLADGNKNPHSVLRG
jgi:hypothetical protein